MPEDVPTTQLTPCLLGSHIAEAHEEGPGRPEVLWPGIRQAATMWSSTIKIGGLCWLVTLTESIAVG